MRNYWFYFVIVLGFATCSVPTSAEQIMEEAIRVAGGVHYNQKEVSFDFRGKTYVSCRNNGIYTLKRISRDSVTTIDVLFNDGFKRYVNGKQIELADSTATKYTNSVNSVHYFAYLPYGLTGTAVNKELLGEVRIKDRLYYKIKVWFDKEGGGEDFEDVFVYWIDKENYQLDYLAYEFHVNGGGMRFREAYNKRVVGGIQFVDYNNFKPHTNSSSLVALDSLFKIGALEYLSKIELTQIKVSPESNCSAVLD